VTIPAATPVFELTRKECKGPGDVCKKEIGPYANPSCLVSLCDAPTSQWSPRCPGKYGDVRVYTKTLVLP